MATDTSAAILRAARSLFLKQGAAVVSLDSVRRAAGVSNGSLFHHFPTKGHLARGLYLHALASYQAALGAPLSTNPRAKAGVEALVDAHLDWVLAQPEEARVLAELREATTVEGEAIEWGSVNHTTFGELSSWIARGVERGELQSLPLPVWLALTFAPALALTSSLTKKRTKSVSPAVRRALVAAAWHGVRAQR